MNRLAAETSPYLRQHADNPVDWFPWGDAAFDEARRRDRPVFLSVGYSSCHWCHVMAHESFEDEATASDLNRGFVAIKVDREERPDVDAVYMEAVQALTGQGGWPMSVFLTPDGRPFYGGTYFPDRDRQGMPSFRRVLSAIGEAWELRRDEVEQQADALADAVARRSTLSGSALRDAAGEPAGSGPSAGLDAAVLLAAAVDELCERFDDAHGGFGPAPKFPQPGCVELCLRHHRLTGDPRSLQMATGTLGAMAAGGIHDHVGGGFARYSTDPTWTVPHFEKMLYDQAGLIRVYLHAWQVTADPSWLGVVEDTVGYVLRDLARPRGGVASAEDADSDGEEGRFYVWTPEELLEAVGPSDARTLAGWYGVDDPPNFDGRWILRRPPDGPLQRPDGVEEARRRLLEARGRRIRPALDDKVLTEWNAMFISSLAEAAAATGRPDWADAAGELGSFLWANLRRDDGRWLRSWQGGRARHLAYASDHAWLVDAFTRLAELTGKASWLERAEATADDLVGLFAAPDGDGLLASTGSDAPRLLVRPIEVLDGSTPSANSVAATALVRLGTLVGRSDLVDTGTSIVTLLAPVAARHPAAMANLVAASALIGGGTIEVVVAGNRPDLVEVVQRRYEPTAVLAWGDRTASPLWEGRDDGRAYVCRRFTCRTPATTSTELLDQLDAERGSDGASPGAPAGPSSIARGAR